jgi:hypothetical protein
MASNVDIILRGKNEASAAIKQVKADLGGLDSTAKSLAGGLSGIGSMIGVAGLATAAMQIGRMTVELGNLGQEVQQQRAYFNVWSGGVENATANLAAMREAIGGVMTDSEAMTGANKLLSMGLAKNADELANLSKMAVMLGGSTRSASESINEFSLLLANQSVLRLDTFGISGAKVRARIEELMAADAGLSREQAFLNAVMEEGTVKVNALEAAGVKATTGAQDLATAWRGLREAIGEGLAPALAESQAGLARFMSELSASIQAGSSDAQIALGGLRSELQFAQADLAALEAQPLDPNDEFGTAAAQSIILRARIADLEAQIISLGGASVDMGEKLRGAVAAAAAAAGAAATYQETYFKVQAPSDFLVNQYEGRTAAETAAQEEYGRAMALMRTLQYRKDEELQANLKIADDYYNQMAKATDKLTDKLVSDINSKLSGAISASISLSDMTGGDIFAPGSNGPFEAIYRAQAVAVGGIENADEQRWAEMYGLTPETAAKIVADFQKGLFTADVQKLIDVNALVGQIQGEQAAAESTAAFANMIAGKLGVTDAGALVASRTFQAIAGGVQADDTQQANAAKAVLEAYATNVQAVVKSEDYAGRMIGFGKSTWVYYEQGLLDGAKVSGVFNEAIGAAVIAFLISRGYGASNVVDTGRSGGTRP